MKSASLAVLALVACSHAPSPTAPPANRATTPAAVAPGAPLIFGDGPLLLRGTITRELGAYSDDRPFIAAAGNQIELELRRYEGEDTGAPLVLARTLTLPAGPVTFPLTFELHGTLPATNDTLLVGLEFRSGADARPKQLLSEYRNELRPGVDHLDLTVTGLEPCDAPNAGGFCG